MQNSFTPGPGKSWLLISGLGQGLVSVASGQRLGHRSLQFALEHLRRVVGSQSDILVSILNSTPQVSLRPFFACRNEPGIPEAFPLAMLLLQTELWTQACQLRGDMSCTFGFGALWGMNLRADMVSYAGRTRSGLHREPVTRGATQGQQRARSTSMT